MRIEEQISLAQLTTFAIGGRARYFVRVKTVDETQEAFAFASEKNIQTLILGGGSNMLINDTGFDGLVIKMEISGIIQQAGNADTDILEHSLDGLQQKNVSISISECKILLIVGAGESWDGFVEYAVLKGLWGVENLSGIPGTVGASPLQNVGAYGVEVSNTILWVEAFDTQTKKLVRFLNNECNFGYRTSIFKKNVGRFCITHVAFSLRKDSVLNITYRDLAETFAENKNPSLEDIRATVLSIRKQKFPDLSKDGTAGSFFLNPIVSNEVAMKLHVQYPAMPQYMVVGGVKLSLAWILDNVLMLRGTRVGGARIFEKQPLVIVAERYTSSHDVRTLAELVVERMNDIFGIKVEVEVRIL